MLPNHSTPIPWYTQSLEKPVAIFGIKLIHKRIAACCQQKVLSVPNTPLVPVPHRSSAGLSVLHRNSALLSYQSWVLVSQDTAQPHTDPNLGPGNNTALSAMLSWSYFLLTRCQAFSLTSLLKTRSRNPSHQEFLNVSLPQEFLGHEKHLCCQLLIQMRSKILGMSFIKLSLTQDCLLSSSKRNLWVYTGVMSSLWNLQVTISLC